MPAQALAGKHVLVVSHRPTELVQQLALSLSSAGAHVTLALRHAQDGRCLVKRLSSPGITSSVAPLNTARLVSVHDFAAAINNSGQLLDLLIVDSWDLHAAGSKDRRWYTPQGVSGKAQTGFIGPAVLLHQLQPTLAANGTAMLLTASPIHRRATLENLQDTLTSWSSSSLAATQAALLSYVRRLALQLEHKGVKAAAVDIGVLSEQPLKGSLLRKLPVLRQAIHLLLPSAHDAAGFLTGVAGHLLSSQAGNGARLGGMSPSHWNVSTEVAGTTTHTGSTTATALDSGAAGAAAASSLCGQTRWDPQHPDTPALELPPSAVQGGAAGRAPDVQADSDQSAAFDLPKQFSIGKPAQAAPGSGQARSSTRELWGPGDAGSKEGASGHVGMAAVNRPDAKPFSYISCGLLANPLVTALDHAGSSTVVSRTLQALTGPLYDLTSASMLTAACWAEWPARAVGGGTAWLEVPPSGAVLDERLGWRLWHLVEGYCSRGASAE